MNLADVVSALIPDAETARFAVAVSGGADSLALLLRMAAAFPGRVQALTVDHRLRPESAQEAAQVAQWCDARRVPHRTLVWEAPSAQGNLQAAARAARYTLLADWCTQNSIGYVLTGHTQDDVAETLLMRLARGAGVRGLAAMEARRALTPEVTLLRPLLTITHAELVAWLTDEGQPWIEDPSNQNEAFDRIRIRRLLAAPPLATFTSARIAMSARALARADTALDWASDHCFTESAQICDGEVIFRNRNELLQLPVELVRRMLLRAMDQVRGAALPPRQEDLERLLSQLASQDWRGSTLGKCRFSPVGPGFKVEAET